MSLFEFSFTTRSKTLVDRMKELGEKDFSERAADHMLERIRNEFLTEGESVGWKKPELRDGRTLIDSSKLMNCWKKREASPGTWEVYADTDEAPYAPYVEFGIDWMVMSEKQRRKLFGYIIPKDKFDETKITGEGVINVEERPMGRPAYEATKSWFSDFIISSTKF